MGHFSINLDKHHRIDLFMAFLFSEWLLRRGHQGLNWQPDAREKIVALMKKVQELPPDKGVDFNHTEFEVVYVCVQYALNLLGTPTGQLFMTENLAHRGQEWIDEKKKSLSSSYMYFINECNNKFDDIPTFVKMKLEVEKVVSALA